MGPAIALPPSDGKWLVISAMQVMVIATAYFGERQSPAEYSKFGLQKAGVKMLPSRAGMLIIYTPAFLCAVVQLIWDDVAGVLDTPNHLSVMLFVHFLKRELEVVFVHTYSGGMPLVNACMIGIFYSFAVLMMNAAVRTVPAVTGPPGFPWLGSLLFLAGEAGNAYHHWLLSALRKSGGGDVGRGYRVPQGGLFSCVTMPHYFCELVAFYGMALVCRQLNILLQALSFTSYLAGRAVTTTEWYVKNVPSYPAARRHIVPFLF